MAKKTKYPEEKTRKAWDTVFRCLRDDAKYNDHTQPALSVQDALAVVMDALPSVESGMKVRLDDEDMAYLYYHVYRGLMLSELRNLGRFDITFAEKGQEEEN